MTNKHVKKMLHNMIHYGNENSNHSTPNRIVEAKPKPKTEPQSSTKNKQKVPEDVQKFELLYIVGIVIK